MADLSPDIQQLLQQYDTPKADNTLSPDVQTLLKKYDPPAAPADTSESYKYVTPEEQKQIEAYKPALGTTLGNVGMNALIAMRNGYDNTPYPLKLVAGPFGAVQSLVASAGDAVSPYLSKIPGIENVITPAALGRDLAGSPDSYAGSPGALVTPRQFVPSIPKASGVTVPLAQNEAPMVGSGYLNGEGIKAPTGRTFDVAPDGSVKLAEAPGTDVAVTAPATTVEPAAPVPGPSPGMGGPPSESTVGAAQTPAGQATLDISRGEARARQAMDEGNQLLQSDSDRRVGLIDTNQYVPGIIRTLGRMDLAHAAEESAFRDKFPTEFKNQVDTPNNNTLVQYVNDATPTDLEKFNLEAARDRQAAIDIAPMKNEPKPVDTSGTLKLINDQLDEGAADRGFVNNALENVKKTLIKGIDDEGNPILRDDPNRLYNGARKNITDMLERAKADPASNEATAYAHLMDIKKSLDADISSTNPSFRTYLDNYSDASKPIDEATVMGGIRKSLTDMNGQMTLGRVHKVLTALDTARNDKAGANPAQHVTFDTMQKIFDVRNELQAQAARDAFVKANGGSNTHLRILNGQKYVAPPPTPIRNMLTNLGESALHYGVGSVDPTSFGGNALIRFGAENMRNRTAAMNEAKAQAMNDAHDAALRSRLQNFISPPMDSEGNPMIGHNGGPPLEP